MTNGKADPPVTRLVVGTGQNQVAHTGQSHKSISLPAERFAEAAHLGQAPGDQGRTGIGTKAQPVTDACGDRHHVFNSAAQLYTANVGTGVDPGTSITKPRGDPRRVVAIYRRDGQGRGQPSRYFPGETRPGDYSWKSILTQHLFKHIAQQQCAVGLKSFGTPAQAGFGLRRCKAGLQVF